MKQQRAVVVTCAAQNAALAAIRSLHDAGWRVIAVDHNPRAKGFVSRGCDEHWLSPVSPASKPAAYAAWLLEQLRAKPAAVLVPVTDAAIFALLPRRDELEALTAVPWPSTASLEEAADKNRTFALAAELGLAIPPQVVWRREEPLPPAMTYPTVIKPLRSMIDGGKIAVAYAADEAELRARTADWPAAAFPVLLQERVVGAGEGYFGVWRHGEPVVECAHRRRREMPPSGGVSTLREAIPLTDDLREPARRLLAHWRWHGPAMVEFKRGRDGRPYLMEVNGRLWGSLQLAVDAGIDIPLASVLVAVGEPVPPMTYHPGVRTRWELGDLDALITRLFKRDRDLKLPPNALSRGRWIWDFVADFFRAGVRTELWRRNDTHPFWRDLRDWMVNKRWMVAKRVKPPAATRAVSHLHSTISYDGEMSVAAIATLLHLRGVHVGLIAEHVNNLTQADVDRLAAECRRYSEADLLLVPGLEFATAEGCHVLGLGCAKLIEETDPARLTAAIRAAGGLAVLAHPHPECLTADSPLVRSLDGVEIWNTMHDGAYVPNPQSIDRWLELGRRGIDLAPLHGNDFHCRDHFKRPRLEFPDLKERPLDWPTVREAIRARRYRLSNDWLQVPADRRLAWWNPLFHLLKAAQRAIAKLKQRLTANRLTPCWEYLGCEADTCCVAREQGPAGLQCWRIVGTFAGQDRRGSCCRHLPDCRECEYYRFRNAPGDAGRPRRILHLIETVNPGGAELMMLNLIGALDRRRYTSHVVLIKHGWLEARLREMGVPVTVLPLQRKLDWRFARAVARLARRRHFDLLHSHEFTMNGYAFLAGRLARKATVATVHGNLEYLAQKRRRQWFYWWIAGRSGPMVTVSEELKRRLSADFKLPVERLTVIHNGVALPAAEPDAARRRELRGELGLPADATLLGVIGRLHPVKGQDVLLAALPELRARFPRVHLGIVGQGLQQPFLAERVRELGLTDAVTFAGYRENIREYLGAFDLIVVPSRYEGLSLLLIEAMAAGRPIVATRVGGNPEAIADGVSGLLVPPDDPAALAAAAGRILGDPELAAGLGRAARARAEESFSIAAMLAAYDELYRRKMEQRS